MLLTFSMVHESVTLAEIYLRFIYFSLSYLNDKIVGIINTLVILQTGMFKLVFQYTSKQLKRL